MNFLGLGLTAVVLALDQVVVGNFVFGYLGFAILVVLIVDLAPLVPLFLDV
jgi:hypothetical protein